MLRRVKPILWLIALLIGLSLVLTAIGVAEPYASPSALPVSPTGGVLAGFAVVIGAVVLTSAIDVVVWRRMGATAGLPAQGLVTPHRNPPAANRQFFASPPLAGTVRGREVRARTFSRGGGQHGSPTTHTVVQTDVDGPAELRGMIAPVDNQAIHHLPDVRTEAEHWRTIDGDVAVWGSITADQARAILSPRVRDSISALGTGITIGDVGQEIVDQFAEAIPDEEDTASATAARGFLSMGGSTDDGAAQQVSHPERRLERSAERLELRARTVAEIAEAVEALESQ